MIEALKDIAPEITVLGALTLIQISPLKLNPWSWVVTLLRKLLGTEGLRDDIKQLDAKVKSLERDIARTRSKEVRKEIIDFAEELKRGKMYHLAEFEEVGRIVDEYRKLIDKYDFKNAYCVAQMEYIEEQMKERGVVHEDE